VKALIEAPPGKDMLGVSEKMGWEAWTELWSSILGVRARYVQVPLEEYLKDLPETLAREVGESVSFNTEFGWTGGDPQILDPKEISPNVQVTSVADYIRGEDWSSIL